MPIAFVRPDLIYGWKGSSLFIANTRGECGSDQRLSGYFYREARHLRTLRLEIDGEPPWLCDVAALAPGHLACTYVHPEVTSPGGGGTGHSDDREHVNAKGLPERGLDLRVDYRVGIARLDARLVITNRTLRPLTFDVEWIVDADFADIQEAQNDTRQQQGPVDRLSDAGVLALTYQHPSLPYTTLIEASGDRTYDVRRDRFHAAITLDPQETTTTELRIVPRGVADDPPADAVREQALRAWMDSFTRVTAPGNRLFEDVVSKNIRDVASFAMLEGKPDEWLALQAGVPLYPAFFGRDALTAGWQAALVDRGQCLDAALVKLGRLQSNRVDEWHDEEPGRVPYQVRQGPLALLKINPYAAYYADYASPLMYVISLANLYGWTGDMTCVTRHWDTVRRILDWARDYGDKDRDGYLEYFTRSKEGTKNQGWKDSGDAIIYEDGRPVPAPIATCELQGYWHLAQELMAVLCWARGDRADASAWMDSATALKERFNRDWWLEDEGFVALALDPDKRPVPGGASNVGHCLACGIISSDHVPPVVGRLFAPDMFSGWGVRTLSSNHRFYNPLSYHRGTVWAVEQATIAYGLRRFGFDARALDIATALFDLAQLYPEHRIPECIGGYARGDRDVPGAYPRSNTPQLWNASAFPLVVQTMLGLVPLAPAETLVLDPVLPSWLPEIVLEGLRVGEASVTLRCWRKGDGRSDWEVLQKRGTLHIVRQPPVESLTASLGNRLRSLFETAVH